MTDHPGISEVWASAADPGDISEPANGVKTAGYTGTPAPVYQYINWMFKYLFQGVRHLLSRGIPEWNAAETYEGGATVKHENVTYVAIGTGANHEPPNLTYWMVWEPQTFIDAAFARTNASALVTTATSGGSISGAEIQAMNGKKRLTYNVGGTGPGTVSVVVDLSGAADFTPRVLTWSISTSNSGTIATAQIIASAHAQTVYVTGVGSTAWTVSVVAEE